jgi:cytochrome bd-type quinol oxidase subunit 2
LADPRINTGPGRVLVAVYGLFALSATARAGVQIGTKFHEAPLAFLLSALAGVIYIAATVGLARANRRLALACCTVELVGVLVVGTASWIFKSVFPDATVWSGYGAGYGFVPLVLPVLGLLWLRHTRRRPPRAAGAEPDRDVAKP